MRVKLVGGPLDGGTLNNWQWHDNNDGRRGKKEGVIIPSFDLIYKLREQSDPAIADYVSGNAPASLIEAVVKGSTP